MKKRFALLVTIALLIAAIMMSSVCSGEGLLNKFSNKMRKVINGESDTIKPGQIDYVPIEPYTHKGEVHTIEELHEGNSKVDHLTMLYGMYDRLCEQYPGKIIREEIPSDFGPIVDAVPDSSEGNKGDIVLIPTDDGGYIQYIKLSKTGWTKMNTWDENGNEIDHVYVSRPTYVYTIIPDGEQPKDSFLLLSGIHGNEDGANAATFYITKELLDHMGTGDALDKLTSDHLFRIVPAMNPTSISRHKWKEHGFSENLINANRDFPVDWCEYITAYDRTGNVPLYDPYNRIMVNYLKSLTDVSYYLVRHDNASISQSGIVGYLGDRFEKSGKVMASIAADIESQVVSDHKWIVDDFHKAKNLKWDMDGHPLFKVVTGTLNQGLFTAYMANELGLHGGILEIAATAGERNLGVYTSSRKTDMIKVQIEITMDLFLGASANLDTILSSNKTSKMQVAWKP